MQVNRAKAMQRIKSADLIVISPSNNARLFDARKHSIPSGVAVNNCKRGEIVEWVTSVMFVVPVSTKEIG